MASDIIDFQSERGRHEELLGREDVLAELDALLLGASSRGWVLVKGGPGMGKSALLAEWLKRREDAGHPVSPHHFLRRGVEDWDRPEAVKSNLAAQLERLYPALADPDARPDLRLRELLQRVSDKELKPRNERLVLVVDGLDEVEGEPDGSNPLPRFLPHVLPPGVKVLCASRPTYPYLSWLEKLEPLRTLDLDGERWTGSNKSVVRQYWKHVASRFVPPLTSAFVSEAVQRAEGNVLYAVKLAEWLQEQPVEKQRAELLPRGLEALLEESWGRIQQLPGELRKVAFEGLGVLAVAREALPLSSLATVAHWKEVEDGERFLRVARSFLLEEPGHAGREKVWRPFHESFRSFILSKLGHERERKEHLRLAEQLCRWPVEASDRGLRWSYALRHGVTHWLKAGERARARSLYTNLGYLEAKCRFVGVTAVEEDLRSGAEWGSQDELDCALALHRAIQSESHGLRKFPDALALLVYNRLRSFGWTSARIEETLHFPGGLPALRLRHPVRIGSGERTLEGHLGSVRACAVTPDGRRVVSASDDKTLKIWELETGLELATLRGHEAWVMGCAVTPDGRRVVSASDDRTLKVWDAETGQELATWRGHEAAVNGCAVTPDGRHMVSASDDESLKIWDLDTGRELATLRGHGGGVSGCAVMPDGRRVVSASYDRTLKVWDWVTGRELASLEGHTGGVRGCAVLPDGRRVVSVSNDGTLKIWDVETRRELATLTGHEGWVRSCAVLPDGQRVVSASDDGTLKLWDVETRRELATLKAHGDCVGACTVTPDGHHLVSASEDGTLKIWAVEPVLEPFIPRGHSGWVNRCAVTPDGQRVVSASNDKTLKVWDLKTGRELATLEGHRGVVSCCAMMPDGQRVVSASDDGTLKIWDVETGRELVTLEGDGDWQMGCAWSSRGDRVLAASANRTLKIWDVKTGRKLATLRGHQGGVRSCVVMPDGRYVVSASNDKTLKIWDVETGREAATLKGHGGWVMGCTVTPDGRRVVSSSDDKTLKVWDVETWQELATLRGHEGWVSGCAVTPDGRHVVSASYDKTLKVWEIDSGRCLSTLFGAGAFLSVAATSDVVCAGDVLGNVWILEMGSSTSRESPPRTRDSVFISSSKKDEKWLKQLETQLAPLVRSGVLEVWSDTHIQAGADRKAELENALAHARVAVLLVSADYLASDLIARHELPPLLSAAASHGLKILWVPIRASLVERTEIWRYPSPIEPAKPLAGLSRAQAEAAWVKVCTEIEKALK